jgi:hypothetical protein
MIVCHIQWILMDTGMDINIYLGYGLGRILVATADIVTGGCNI